MRKKSKLNSFRAELFQAALIVGLSAALGLAVNAFSANPLRILSDDSSAVVVEAPGRQRIEAPGQQRVEIPIAVPRRIPIAELMQARKVTPELVRVVDVRSQAQYDAGHVPDAIHATLETILKSRVEIDSLLAGATLIVAMCDSDDCPKAESAADALTKLGYKNVRVLAGGWDGYSHSGNPIEETRR